MTTKEAREKLIRFKIDLEVLRMERDQAENRLASINDRISLLQDRIIDLEFSTENDI